MSVKCPKCGRELRPVDDPAYGTIYVCGDHDRPIIIIEVRMGFK